MQDLGLVVVVYGGLNLWSVAQCQVVGARVCLSFLSSAALEGCLTDWCYINVLCPEESFPLHHPTLLWVCCQLMNMTLSSPLTLLIKYRESRQWLRLQQSISKMPMNINTDQVQASMPPRTLRCVKYVTGTSSQAFVWAQPNPRPTSSFSTPTSQFPGASRIRPSTKAYYAESLSFSNPWYILSSCCENNLSSREAKGKFSRWPSTAAWERRTRTSWLLSLFSQIMLLLRNKNSVRDLK